MNNKSGFTLIELLTVVLILAILTSMALPQYRRSIQRAEAANALVDLKTMFDGAKRYYAYHSSWPTSLVGLDVEFLDVSSNGEVGEFKYSMVSTNTNCSGNGTCYVSACRLKENASSNTYCLKAYYKKTVNSTLTRDVYTCQDNASGKYAPLCDSLCPADYSSGECVIQ